MTTWLRVPSTDSSASSDEKDTFLESHPTEGELSFQSLSRRLNRLQLAVTAFNIACLTITVILFGKWYHETHLAINVELRRVQPWSPVLDEIDLGLHDTVTNGTLFPPRNPSSTRMPPNHTDDGVWDDWDIVRFIPITREHVLRMGKDPATVARFENDIWGFGDDAYVGDLDVFHQLHCLNTLRKYSFAQINNQSHVQMHHGSNSHINSGSHSKRGPVGGLKTFAEFHLTHCVDIIAQALQCSGNVNFITDHWVETQPYPFPDMSVQRKCIDFDRLTEWRNRNAVDTDKYLAAMAKPPGILERPAPDALYQWYDLESPNHVGGKDLDEDFNF